MKIRILLALLCFALLAACGTKGPLVLPSPSESADEPAPTS